MPKKPMKPKPKQPFTADEIRIVLKWAAAYNEMPDRDTSIGTDTLFDDELKRLRAKLKDVSSEFMLGALNTGFLLGFDSMSKRYPLEELWLKFRHFLLVGMMGEDEVADYRKFVRFLAEAGLIDRESQ